MSFSQRTCFGPYHCAIGSHVEPPRDRERCVALLLTFDTVTKCNHVTICFDRETSTLMLRRAADFSEMPKQQKNSRVLSNAELLAVEQRFATEEKSLDQNERRR